MFVKAPNVSYALKNQYANGVLVCIFLKSFDSFRNDHSAKVTKISGRKFSKSSFVKGVIIVSILLIKYRDAS
jgi:hypothetical protein